jgi:uncharacterized protein with PQ loop repeat
MRNIKTYQQHEGFKSALVGAGLVGSLLTSPDVSAREKQPISLGQELPAQDGVVFYRMIDTISKSRIRKSHDEKLNAILNEIKENGYTQNSAKYVEMFNKLSDHLENEYDWKFEDKDIKKLDDTKISDLKSKKDQLTLMEILGWIGSICLAICGVPQAWMSYKDKHSHGISWAFLLLWAFGELFALAYVYDKLDLPLLLNYSINILIVGVILFFKINPNTSSIEIEDEEEDKNENMKIKKFDQFNEGLFDFIGRNKRGNDIMDIINTLSPDDVTKEDNQPVEITYKFDNIEVTRYLNVEEYYVIRNEKELGLSQEVSKSIYDRLVEIKG